MAHSGQVSRRGDEPIGQQAQRTEGVLDERPTAIAFAMLAHYIDLGMVDRKGEHQKACQW